MFKSIWSLPLIHSDSGSDAIGDDSHGDTDNDHEDDDSDGHDVDGGGSHGDHDIRIIGTCENSVTLCLWHVRLVRDW